ncbi:hypothetical protein T4C_6127, partial [Trichinella pseudospiralis]
LSAITFSFSQKNCCSCSTPFYYIQLITVVVLPFAIFLLQLSTLSAVS